MDIKRDASGVVDAISAEDIGKFPDTNLAESLQRIPGVSIDRVNGEGSQVTVRGFGPTFNLVTLNGRQMRDVGRERRRRRPGCRLRPRDQPLVRLLQSRLGRRAAGSRSTRPAAPRFRRAASAPRSTSSPGARSKAGRRAARQHRRQGGLRYQQRDFEDVDAGSLRRGELVRSRTRRSASRCSAPTRSATARPRARRRTIGTSVLRRLLRNPGRRAATHASITNAPARSQPRWSRSRTTAATTIRNPSVSGSTAGATLQFRPIETLTITADALYARNERRRGAGGPDQLVQPPVRQRHLRRQPDVATAIYLEKAPATASRISASSSNIARPRPSSSPMGFNVEWEIADGFTLTLDGNHSTSSEHAQRAQRRQLDAGRLRRAGGRWPFGGLLAATFPQSRTGDASTTLCRGNNNGVLDIGDLGTPGAAHQRIEPEASHQPGARRPRLGVRRRWPVRSRRQLYRFDDDQRARPDPADAWRLGHHPPRRRPAIRAAAWSSSIAWPASSTIITPTDAQIAFRGNAVDLYKAFADAYAARCNPINVTGNDFDRVQEKIFVGLCPVDLERRDHGPPAAARRRRALREHQGQIHARRRSPTGSTGIRTTISAASSPGSRNARRTSAAKRIRQSAAGDRLPHRADATTSWPASRTARRWREPDYGNLFASEVGQRAQPADRARRRSDRQHRAIPACCRWSRTISTSSLEWYFAPIELLSAGFFYKKVKNFVGTGRSIATCSACAIRARARPARVRARPGRAQPARRGDQRRQPVHDDGAADRE